MQEVAIFGAKSTALGIYTAIKKLYKDCRISEFLVSDKKGNPDTLAGIPVIEVNQYNRKEMCILIAVPENLQLGIVTYLEEQGFYNYICIDSRKEAELMERYYAVIEKFPSLHAL